MPLVALSAAAMTLASASTLAATVYKWTDERGVVHYSDQPHPEAKEVDVKPAPAISSVPPPSCDVAAQQTPLRCGGTDIFELRDLRVPRTTKSS